MGILQNYLACSSTMMVNFKSEKIKDGFSPSHFLILVIKSSAIF